MEVLPHILDQPAVEPRDINFVRRNVAEVRKVATFWLVPQTSKLSRSECEAALAKGMSDDQTAATVVSRLNHSEHAVLAAYRRYGGTVNGTVIRMDLLARGLLEKKEKRFGTFSSWHWKRNPMDYLAERGALLTPSGSIDRYGNSHLGYGDETEKPFPTYGLNAALAKVIKPASPPGWTVPAVEGDVVSLGSRSSAEVVLDLSRVYAFIASRSALKVKKTGDLATPSLRTLAKAVPLTEDPKFPLPEPHGLYYELLRENGLVRVGNGEARADPAAANPFFALPTAVQAHHWTRAWWHMNGWIDGAGCLTADASAYGSQADSAQRTSRQVLAWALASLAHAGAVWFDLSDFVVKLYDDLGNDFGYHPWQGYAWDAKLPFARDREQQHGEERRRAFWFSQQGSWYANAVMVTLAALGLVERGRSGGKKAAYCFRLTSLGRAVFGAPELAPSLNEPGRFLVIQPNFDVLVYLDQGDAQAVGTLGQLLESTSPRSGPVQTYRLTRTSFCQALEGGMNHAGIVDLLRRYSQRELPANVLQTLHEWAGRRESLVLRTNVNLLGFPSSAERDRYLTNNTGTPLGERFVLLTDKKKPRLSTASFPVVHQDGILRSNLEIDEHGRLRSREPYDTVQTARLRRFAVKTPSGWQVTAAGVAQAAAAGHKAGLLRLWLTDHLVTPLPPLLDHALDAWTGKTPPLELARAVVLHVPDDELFDALIDSPRIRPLLCGSPGNNWLVVRDDRVQELEDVLGEFGFRVNRELTQLEFPRVEEA